MEKYYWLLYIIGFCCVFFLLSYILKIGKKIKLKHFYIKQTDSEFENFKKVFCEVCNENRNKISNLKVKLWIFRVLFIVAIVYFIVEGIGILKEGDNIAQLLLYWAIFPVLAYLVLYTSEETYFQNYKKIVMKESIEKSRNNIKYYKGLAETIVDGYIDNSDVLKEYVNADFYSFRVNNILVDEYWVRIYENVKVQTFKITPYNDIIPNHNRNARHDFLKHQFKDFFTIINKKTKLNMKILSKKNIKLDEKTNEFNYFFYSDSKENISQRLQQFLTEFRYKYKVDFDIVFKDKIYIRFYTMNLFTHNLSGNIVKDESIYQFFVMTKLAEELLNLLNEE